MRRSLIRRILFFRLSHTGPQRIVVHGLQIAYFGSRCGVPFWNHSTPRHRMIDKLELLLALARERHFGRAADVCGVTQPTMSAAIKQLEEVLGVMLVQRGSRFQGFTPEGERVLDWARRIVGDIRAMRQEVNALRHGLSGE